MLIDGDDISNEVITIGTCFSMFFYIRARFHFDLIGGNLTAESTGSHREIGGGIQIPFLFQSRSQSAPESLLEGYENNEYQCITLILVYTLTTKVTSLATSVISIQAIPVFYAYPAVHSRISNSLQ